jgi:hypothetical protein
MKRGVFEYVAFVTLVRESRMSINDLQDCCNPCEYSSGSENMMLWILF